MCADATGDRILPERKPPQCIKEPCDSFRGTYKLSDGSTYSGELDGGEPHGYGDLVYPDGNYYEGEFRHGERSGTGSLLWITIAIVESGKMTV